MIRSFRDDATEALFNGRLPKGFPADVLKVARRKLAMVHAAARLDDLRIPPGNRLEALSGDRAGQYSIRVNDRWRICFVWSDAGAENVEFVDYH
ncbi:type II toxin-antitoxin system RelE/ParE family toxin [Methylocystis heyeri]|uniref:Type II toxin-antitoxin system RelE/ParE family toxin n=1 Tax=Methylocystis heyeri TaxID=391905 RepID=A0A6B8KDV2_9HYPH|nr:type II toxin-antitoxin system RelE/ParE family toxin [Methylocystis heyeri]QGM45879.1 type II toxin-antitoxin system RelE/ParE family toxin [Methylocystis heyeri]